MHTLDPRSVYLLIGGIVTAFVTLLVALVRSAPAAAPAGETAALVAPVLALVALTAVVCALMIVFRNLAFARRLASLRYFRGDQGDAPAEWIERPARAYMNLLELPVLFYVVCLLMMATGRFDTAQVWLAWLFVAARYAHAFIHVGFNYVPLRFTAYFCGVITLGVLWVRFAVQNLG